MYEDIVYFLSFANNFRNIKRAIYAVGSIQKENDTEHSFQLAIFTWYVIDKYNLKLDSSLAIKYALIHDLPEVFAGDIPTLKIKDPDKKKRNEKKAQRKIVNMFPGWRDYKDCAENYENLVDEESMLVNGLDKILPVVNLILDGGKTWKEEPKTTLEVIKENKRRKVNVHPFTEKMWYEIEKVLEENELGLFGKLSTARK